MKVAHLILAYKDPELVERLVRTLTNHHDFDCWIHIDKKTNITAFNRLKAFPRTRFIKKRVVVNWAGFSFVKAMMSSLGEIINSRIKYDFVNLMSGQDYPIKPLQQIHDFLTAHKGKSFITCEPEPSLWWDHAVVRFTKYHFTDFPFKGKTRIERLLNRVMPERKFLSSFTLYGGPCASYWTLSMVAAKYTHDFIKGNKKLLEFCKFTWAPDEFLISTILMNSHLRDTIISVASRYIDWSSGGARPRVLTTDDFYSLKESPLLFARKFDLKTDAGIINLIDSELLKM
jgi:core-2/I-Branching enzyme